MTIKPFCNIILKYFLLIISCAFLIFATNGCREKYEPTEEDIARANMSDEERLKYDLEKTYPGKTFKIIRMKDLHPNMQYTDEIAYVECLDDGITFGVNTTNGLEEYQMQLWEKGYLEALNKKLTELYGDNYIIDHLDTNFMVYGFYADINQPIPNESGSIGDDHISPRFYNTTYDEAMTMLADQEKVVDSYVKISCYVFTDEVDKEKEIENAKELLRQFILPIEDEIFDKAQSQEHRRKYILDIIYLEPYQKELVYLYENYPPLTQEERDDRDKYVARQTKKGDVFTEMHEAEKNASNEFLKTFNGESDPYYILTEDMLDQMDFMKYFKN